MRTACMRGLLLTMAISGAACSRPNAEQRLRDTIAVMEQAIEAGEAGEFIEHVATDFSGQGDTFDQRQLRAILMAQALRHENVSVIAGPLDVKMYGERASVNVRVLATGGRWFPESGRQIDIESHWRLEDGEWVCFKAYWK